MFVYCMPLKDSGVYIATSEIVKIDAVMEQITTSDGARYTLTGSDLDRLIGDGMIRGVSLEDGKIVAVPLSSVDHVTDEFIADEWVSTVTTKRGLKFIADAPSRGVMNLDAEICDVVLLREQAVRVHAADDVAEAAVEAADALAVRKAG